MARRGGELTDCLHFIAAELDRCLRDHATWQRAVTDVEAGAPPVLWPSVLEAAPTDLAADVLEGAVRIGARLWFDVSGGGSSLVDLESGPDECHMLLKVARRRDDGSVVQGEADAWVRDDTKGGQVLLQAALAAAAKAYRAAVDRFGVGQITGLHDLKMSQRRRRVLAAWRRGASVADAADAASVSLQAAYRYIKARNRTG